RSNPMRSPVRVCGTGTLVSGCASNEPARRTRRHGIGRRAGRGRRTSGGSVKTRCAHGSGTGRAVGGPSLIHGPAGAVAAAQVGAASRAAPGIEVGHASFISGYVAGGFTPVRLGSADLPKWDSRSEFMHQYARFTTPTPRRDP